MSTGLYHEKPVAKLCGCHDPHTTDGGFVLKRTATPTQTGITLNQCHYT